MDERLRQIGEVAEMTGLSLRTIRYYEEIGLVVPAARTSGGFRLYATRDVERLLLVKDMKPLDFSLEEMADLLGLLDELDTVEAASTRGNELRDRVAMFADAVQARVDALRTQLAAAETLEARLQQRRRSAGGSSARTATGRHVR